MFIYELPYVHKMYIMMVHYQICFQYDIVIKFYWGNRHTFIKRGKMCALVMITSFKRKAIPPVVSEICGFIIYHTLNYHKELRINLPHKDRVQFGYRRFIFLHSFIIVGEAVLEMSWDNRVHSSVLIIIRNISNNKNDFTFDGES